MPPQEAVKVVGDAVHKFVAEMQARAKLSEQNVLLVLFNASLRLLLRTGLRPKDLKSLLKDSLDVIRRGG